jgi:hypothetical protein
MISCCNVDKHFVILSRSEESILLVVLPSHAAQIKVSQNYMLVAQAATGLPFLNPPKRAEKASAVALSKP